MPPIRRMFASFGHNFMTGYRRSGPAPRTAAKPRRTRNPDSRGHRFGEWLGFALVFVVIGAAVGGVLVLLA